MSKHVSSTDIGVISSRHFTHSGPVALVIPGLNGSSYSHWQSIWERERNDCRRADLGMWHDPNPALWIKRLDEEIRSQAGPVVLVAHSLGCIATVLWSQLHAEEAADLVKGALLVAPCDPETDRAAPVLRRFAPVPRHRLEIRSILVASSNDPYATLERSRQMAAIWGSEFVSVGALGHINAESDLGSWLDGQALLTTLLEKRQGLAH